MFMQTRLSGIERIMVVNKALNNVNSTMGCLVPDKCHIYLPLSHMSVFIHKKTSSSLQGDICTTNGLLILFSQGFRYYFVSGGIRNQFSFYNLYNYVSCTKINQNKIISTQAHCKYVSSSN